MNITKHISLDESCIKKIKPYIEKHENNFSSAIREIIELAAKNSQLPENSCIIDSSLFRWLLKQIEGVILPDHILDTMIPPHLITSISILEEYVNRRLRDLKWNNKITLKADYNNKPSQITLEITGDEQNIRLISYLVSHFLTKNSIKDVPLKIVSILTKEGHISIEFSECSNKDSLNSLIENFGQIDEIQKTIRNEPKFWKSIINRHVMSNYNMVTLHKNYFEDILSDKLPLGEITIENLAKKPIKDIPQNEMLHLIKEVYETSRVVDRVDIDNNRLLLFHSYRSRTAIEKLKKILVSLLDANGHLYDAKSTANIIVLEHRPEIGTKINDIVGSLKSNRNKQLKPSTGLEQELLIFLTFLRGLRNIPDIPISLSLLGRRIGVSLIQEYEKEKGIKEWNLENFKNAFQIIDSTFHRESNWIIKDNELLYTIKKCEIARGDADGECICQCVCYTIRELFKGALAYAFKNKANLEVKKLITHGDNSCEVLIRKL